MIGFQMPVQRTARISDTILVGANPCASPVSGETAAVVVAMSITSALYGAADVPSSNPAAPPASPTPPAG